MLCSSCGKEIDNYNSYVFDDDGKQLCEDCYYEKMNLVMNIFNML